jgi:hypothetical protein
VRIFVCIGIPEPDVGVPRRDVDRGVDVHDVPVAHVAEDHLQLRELHDQLLDAPGEREDRVPTVDERWHLELEEQLRDRMHDRVVRVIGVEQWMHLHPEELPVREELARLVRAALDPRVRPVQSPGVRDVLNQVADERVVGMEDDAGRIAPFGEQLYEAVSVHADVEEWEVAHVHVRVDDLRGRDLVDHWTVRYGSCRLLTTHS